MTRMLINLNEDTGNEHIGNKAGYLTKLKAAGYMVPDGWVLDNRLFYDILEYNKQSENIVKALDELNRENIEAVSDRLTAIVNELNIPDSLIEEIRSFIDTDYRYAVRSSGTMEDLCEHSFAGQYDTFLNVHGIEDICKDIILCYSSMYSKETLSYLLDNHIDYSSLSMAVIIQRMVDSKVSGVVFTVNPLTGADTEIVVEAADGLGENIVSGRVVPKRCIYNWYVNCFIEGETIVRNLMGAECLDRLLKITLDIQVYMGFPCDIEFAIEKDVIYILQVRAITKILYSGMDALWTTANFKDGGVSSAVCTPYMWSLYEYVWDIAFKRYLVDSYLVDEKEYTKSSRMIYGRPFWNLSIAKLAMSRVPGYREREFDSEYGLTMDYEGDGQVTKLKLHTMPRLVKMAIKQNRIVKSRIEDVKLIHEKLMARYLRYIELYKQLHTKTVSRDRLEYIESIWYRLVTKDYFRSETTYFTQVYINTVQQARIKDRLLKYVSEKEYFNLLVGLKDVSHMRPYYDIWRITRLIKKDRQAREYWTKTDVSTIVTEYRTGSTRYMLDEFREHINCYGYHSKKELDVTYPCYAEEPQSVIKVFKDMLTQIDGRNPDTDAKKQKKIYEDQMNKIKSNVSGKTYGKISGLVEEMRFMMWWREEFKDVSTRYYYLVRIYTIELAKGLVKAGLLDDREDIWYLKYEDICNLIEKKLDVTSLKELAVKRSMYYNSFRNYNGDNEIGELRADNIKETECDDRDILVKGMGCNNHSACGRARIVNDISEIDRLHEGDILVTRFTDTGWTSKFAMINGIVTEYGGILCHATIVSREYGIPCIVCANKATKLIKDGSLIRVDGQTGKVTQIR